MPHVPVRVLLLARDRRFRSVAAALLHWQGYSVDVATGSRHNIELRPPDVVVVDIGRDGLGSAPAVEGPVVLVGEDPDTPSVLDKWGGIGRLGEAIEQALET